MTPSLTIGLLQVLQPALAGVVQAERSDLEEVYAPRRVAVMVGVEDYRDPALQGLRFAAKDANDLGSALSDPDVGGFDHVFVIEGQAATTAQGIKRAIAVATADLQRDDTFVLYMSGHGTLTLDAVDGSKLWFLPSDGLLDNPEGTGIPVAWLEDAVSTLPNRRRVLILDTCHNGRGGSKSAVNSPTAQLLQGLRGEPPAPRNLREVSESEARLYAAQYYQPAMEDPDLGNGVYTHFLLQALTEDRGQADLDGDGLVDVAEAHAFAQARTTKHTGGMQVPRAEYRIVGQEEIYLSGDPRRRSKAEQALLSATDQILAKARILVNGIPRGSGLGLTPVDPGRQTVEVQTDDGRTLARRTLNLEAGETLNMESLLGESGSGAFVLAGATYRHGNGAASVHPAAGELEVGWYRPFDTPRWLVTEFHGRASGMRGPVADGTEGNVTGGELGLGGSVGAGLGPLSLGPVVELMVPWRQFQDAQGVHNQGTITASMGARALWQAPIGAQGRGRVLVRYDSRYAPYVYDTNWTSLWHHGVAIGVAGTR